MFTKEVPSGIIDGINKTFILNNVPRYIDEVLVDGADYISYSVTTNILTLSDAPLHSIYVSYETADTPVPVTTTVTFGDIKTYVWQKLGQTGKTDLFSDTIIGTHINTLAGELWGGRLTSVLDQRIYRAGKQWYKEGKKYLTIKRGATLLKDLNPGDATVSCDSTNLLGSGFVEIGGEVISYTSTNTNGLLGVSLQTVTHIAGTGVFQLYKMPADMDKPKEVKAINKYYNTSDEVPFSDDESKLSFYRVIRVGNVSLLKIAGIYPDTIVEITYEKEYTDMTAGSDICPFPNKYGLSVIGQLVAGEEAFDNLLPQGQSLLVKGYTKLRDMWALANNDIAVIKQSLKPKSYGFTSIRRH